MLEGSYASEPFDLRLTVLRMFRNLKWIVAFTLAGTVLFGGGYYVKNVLLGDGIRYEMTITCKMEYVNPPVQTGDYYINDMTWNTYVDSQSFRDMICSSEAIVSQSTFIDDLDAWTECEGGIAESLSATVASDIHVPSVTVSTPVEAKTEILARAVQEVLTGAFVESVPEVDSIWVLDASEVTPVKPDVRPLRAVILAAILSCFFVTVFFLFGEIGADSIWIPATLRRRYGLKALGTIESRELSENVRTMLKDLSSVAVCGGTEDLDVESVVQALEEKLSAKAENGAVGGSDKDWIPVAFPVANPKSTVFLHGADGVLLVVKAGLHAGKPLEYILEYFAAQDIQVSAALLWDADENLIRSYYFLPDGRK